MDFFVSGANLVPGALGPVQNLMAVIKFARHIFHGNDRRRYVFCAPFKPWSKLVRQRFGGLMDFFVSGANPVPGALGPATGQGPKSDAVIKFARHIFDGNDRRRYVSVRH